MLNSFVFILILILFLVFVGSKKHKSDDDDEDDCKPFGAGTTIRCVYKSTNQKYKWAKNYTYNRYIISDRVFNATGGKPLPPNKYYLTVMSMFKNEAGIMKEWLDHHLAHGVEHFYLVNDNSVDGVEKILKSYVDDGYVTMFPAPGLNQQFRQVGVYNRVLTEIMTKNESHWVAVIDLDEFLWSPRKFDVREMLKKHEELSVIGVNWLWFGSSGHIQQPKEVVKSFTKRADVNLKKYPNLTAHYKILNFKSQKNIINANNKVVQVQVHTADVEGLSLDLSVRRYPNDAPFLINHYSVQAKDFFLKNKGTRGSANGFYKVTDRNLAWFLTCDINEVEDLRLVHQNDKHNGASRATNSGTNKSANEKKTAVVETIW